MSNAKRWPGWVYATGEEPDYRFSFANERTFLAWIRTSMGFLAAAVALDVVAISIPDPMERALVLVLVSLGLSSAATAWLRWAAAERAIRHKAPLPSMGFAIVLVFGLMLAGIATLFIWS